ncbi:MAG: phosphotransferase [Actinomycetota bacterium]|nr:phosphotransferase [Actinomycetota bacterium]
MGPSTCRGQRLVPRRDMGGMIYDYGVDRQGEYRVLDVAYRAGVTVPRPVAYTPDLLGRAAFVMDRLDGEAISRRLISDSRYDAVRAQLAEQLADDLAAIHRLERHRVVKSCQPRDRQVDVQQLMQHLGRRGERHGGSQLVLEERRAPTPSGCARPTAYMRTLASTKIIAGRSRYACGYQDQDVPDRPDPQSSSPRSTPRQRGRLPPRRSCSPARPA